MSKKAPRAAAAPTALVSSNANGSSDASMFAGEALWVGRHRVDGDLLVLDPAEVDPSASSLPFYSLTQFRRRTFPRSVALEKIVPLDDELSVARAEKEYRRRDELEAENGARLQSEDEERTQRQKESVLAAHRRHLDSHGVEFQGVVDTAVEGKKGRRTRCHACGIALDDFVGTCCGVCHGVLCSCGACGCGATVRTR
jgi:hypothetical protein